MHVWDHFYKIVTIGDSNVGKTCIIKRFVDNTFDNKDFISTVGIDFSTKMVHVDDVKIKLQIWDTAGQERFRAITTTYYRVANGVIIVYDITSRETFEQVTHWLNEILLHEENISIPKILVGNKLDRDVNERKVSTEEGRSLAIKNNMMFFETSAYNGTNVSEVFHALTECMLAKGFKQRQQESIVHVQPKMTDSNKKKNCSNNNPSNNNRCCI